MSKPRTQEKIKKSKFVSIGELAVLANMRYSTLKYYTEIGILPFIQEEERRNRKYDQEIALQRLLDINFLKTQKRLTIEEIIQYFTAQSK